MEAEIDALICEKKNKPKDCRSYIRHKYNLQLYCKKLSDKEGQKPEYIIKVGSPMKEVLNHNKNKILNSKILNKLNLKSNNFF